MNLKPFKAIAAMSLNRLVGAGNRLASGTHADHISVRMSDRELVLDAVQEMPETASFREIMDELLLLETVKKRLAHAEQTQRGVPHEDVVKMLDQWITK